MSKGCYNCNGEVITYKCLKETVLVKIKTTKYFDGFPLNNYTERRNISFQG